MTIAPAEALRQTGATRVAAPYNHQQILLQKLALKLLQQLKMTLM